MREERRSAPPGDKFREEAIVLSRCRRDAGGFGLTGVEVRRGSGT